MIGHVVGLLISPTKEWHKIKQKLDANQCNYVPLILILGLIPPVCGYIGTTQFGWQIGTGAAIKLTQSNALMIAIAYYVSIVIGIFVMGYAIKWMGTTYVEKDIQFSQSMALSVFVATPLLLIGAFELYPVLWINFLIGLVALAYSVYLLYTGVSILMDLPAEKSFLFSSAILGFGMISLVVLLVGTAFLWGIGLQPVFTN